MAYWLMKSEPHSYSWDQLVEDGGTEWDGVRNPAARLHLKAMKADPRLAKLEMIRQSRLSVSPVRDEEWAALVEMGS